MTAWSLAAYGLVLNLRSAKTILVEGQTDKQILGRMLLERALSRKTRIACVVDECDLVSDPSLSGLGCRQKVETIALHVGPGTGRLNWLVDREWDGVDLTNPTAFTMLSAMAYGVRTKGHSIENYWLREDALVRYLKMFHGAELSAAFFEQLAERFESMLRIAVAYSVAAMRLGLLTRCLALIRSVDLAWNVDHYDVLGTLNASLVSRGVAVDLAAAVAAEHVNFAGVPCATLTWLCHGHLGEEVVRACAAALAASLGCSPKVAGQIERGRRADKLSHDADFLSHADEAAIEPLGTLLDWAQ